MTRTGFYPGSFDPVTNGHLDIIERALLLFDRLVIGVGAHHGKTPMLALDARVALLNEVAAPIAERAGAAIEVVTFDGLVVEAARGAGARTLVRGLRDASDFDYEMRMARTNGAMAGDVATVFLPASAETGFISSTLVRQIAGMGGDVSRFVPKASARAIAAALAR